MNIMQWRLFGPQLRSKRGHGSCET